jgi:hypothetical protein
MAIALAYHGLLRVPSRAETSDMTPRTPLLLSIIESMLNVALSIITPYRAPSAEPIHSYMALCPPVCKDGCQRGAAICLLCLFGLGSR